MVDFICSGVMELDADEHARAVVLSSFKVGHDGETLPHEPCYLVVLAGYNRDIRYN